MTRVPFKKSSNFGYQKSPTVGSSSFRSNNYRKDKVVDASNITIIKDVDPMLENIIVHGRCISLWHSHRLNEAHNPYSQDMMLQDSQCYYISNFAIAEKSGRLPLLPHKYKISFYKGTMVTRIDDFDNNANGFILEPFNRLLDGTRQYHEHEAVELPEYDKNQFKISLFAPHKSMVTISEFFNGAVKKMVSSIRECEQKSHCIVYAKIHMIHKENGWAYTGCKKCNKKVNVVDTKASSSAGKSKVTFYCEDHGVVQVASRHGMDVDEYWPGELLDLVSKRMLFKLYYLDYNVNNNNHTYMCDVVSDDPTMIKHFKDGFLDEEDDDEEFVTPLNQ
ncbi:replication protein A 70 kDa DNA-binding subunit B, partial [Tanacetum coccineum]